MKAATFILALIPIMGAYSAQLALLPDQGAYAAPLEVRQMEASILARDLEEDGMLVARSKSLKDAKKDVAAALNANIAISNANMNAAKHAALDKQKSHLQDAIHKNIQHAGNSFKAAHRKREEDDNLDEVCILLF